MQISEASIKDMLKQGKSAKDIILAFDIDPKSLDSSSLSLISTLIAMLASFMNTIDSNFQDMNSKIDALTNLLIEKKSKNSSNSSLPPSRDGYKKPNKDRSLRESTGKKPGGQKGHKVNGLLKVSADETTVTNHYPKECMKCSYMEECLNRMKRIATGHVYETKTVIVDNTHKAYEIICPLAKELYRASLEEENITSSQQYGNSIKSAILVLWSIGISSIKRIGNMMKNLFRVSLSEGTIQSIINSFANKCDRGISVIKNYLTKAKVKGADETGLRTDGSLHWLHVVCNDKATYLYPNKKRGFDAIKEDGLLLDATGSLIHDCWSSYFKLDSLTHALCLQHIQRELRGASLTEPKHKEFFQRFENLLLEMRKAKLCAIGQGKTSLKQSEISEFKKKYRALIKEGFETFKKPKRKSRLKLGKSPEGKIRSLLLRLEKYEEAVFLFLDNFDVEFTNNESERSLRGSKVRQSVSKCFRTNNGLSVFAKINTILDTAKKNDIDRCRMINSVLDNTVQTLLESVLV